MGKPSAVTSTLAIKRVRRFLETTNASNRNQLQNFSISPANKEERDGRQAESSQESSWGHPGSANPKPRTHSSTHVTHHGLAWAGMGGMGLGTRRNPHPLGRSLASVRERFVTTDFMKHGLVGGRH